MRRTAARRLACWFAAALAAAPALAAGEERLDYRWQLDGFLGALAGLFVPSEGEGQLTRERLPNGNWKSELLITSSESKGGEYFRYGAEVTPEDLSTVRAWSSSLWRGEERSKEAKVEQSGVIDIVSGIQALRRDPPEAPRPMEIWSDGRLYPVQVLPHGRTTKRIGGREIPVRHLVVSGVEQPGRRFWKGGLELWLADDPAATPVEILVTRSAARVRLSLLAAPALAAKPTQARTESLAVPAAAGAIAPHLATAAGRLYATWIEPAAADGHRVRCARYDGKGWSAPATVAAGADLVANWADTPGIVVAGDGSLLAWYLVRRAGDPHSYDAHLARSGDGGARFEPLGRVNDDGVAAEHGFVSAVAEGQGARLFYLDGRATPGGGATQLRTVRVEGARIGASEALDEAVCDCCPTAAAPLAEGGALVAFRDREAGEVRDVRLLRRPASGPATSQVAGSERWQMPGCPVNGPALAAAGDRLVLAWFSAAGDRPRVSAAVSGDGGRTLSAAVELDAAAPLGRAAAAELPDGFAVAWLARTGNEAELRLARLDREGRPGPPLTLARLPAGRATGVPRLARTGDRLIVAWTAPEPAPGRIEIAALPLAALATR
jgi:hypothetical protein